MQWNTLKIKYLLGLINEKIEGLDLNGKNRK